MRILFLTLSLLLLLTGCNPKPGGKIEAAQKLKCDQFYIREEEVEKEAISLAKKVSGVDDAAAVVLKENTKRKIVVGVKVSNFNRLRMKGIRKEIYDDLEAKYKDGEIHVSTDAKVYKEIETLQKKGTPGSKEESCNQKKELKKIEKDMKG
ncbi:YhcN/YlaJ family sporulation lipoprotein [Thermicanus aegyptius]|uniref:YhcN/YlaJ family sporulation lipoprotein n=1 Tax=Thermicanus aegyptius TaxID=94009 RepID=UPI0003FA0F7C|nr:YhcN/YlaJ family sporulation lipoprotein [Thermicanus aegyptius]